MAPESRGHGISSLQLLLLFVAFHPTEQEVKHLRSSLGGLSDGMGYAVIANDHREGEPVDALAGSAVLFIKERRNLGYGRAANSLVRLLQDELGGLPPFIAVLNTDLSWAPGTFEIMCEWMLVHPEVSLAVPRIVDESGEIQLLCKRNPTLLALLSRRFIPKSLKPHWLLRYDRWYCMADQDYAHVIEATYLSGCCMVFRSPAYLKVGGFDERYFLYLEDADLTRRLAMHGKCIHLPRAEVVHAWGRGNYASLRLMLVNIMSAWIYFSTWGAKVW